MKTTLRTILLLATSLFAFSAFAEDAKPVVDAKTEVKADVKAEAAVTPAKDFVILNVGGEEIKKSEVLDIWKDLFKGGAAPDFASFDENVKQNVLRGIVSERLIYKEAVKSGFDKSDEVKKRLENIKKQLIVQGFIEEKAKSLVTDEQLKAAYDAKIAESKGLEELHASHILVASEDEAKKLSAELKKNSGSFEKLAKEKSTDKASGAKGGDLGWFTKDKMVAEFADAAFKLKKGEVSAPVKSAFGWHIIKLEDRRPVKPATFEESKTALKNELTGKAVQGFVEGLLKNATIKYFDENGKEKEFSKVSVPPVVKEQKPEEKKPEEKK